jgi:hypothetical protein
MLIIRVDINYYYLPQFPAAGYCTTGSFLNSVAEQADDIVEHESLLSFKWFFKCFLFFSIY